MTASAVTASPARDAWLFGSFPDAKAPDGTIDGDLAVHPLTGPPGRGQVPGTARRCQVRPPLVVRHRDVPAIQPVWLVTKSTTGGVGSS